MEDLAEASGEEEEAADLAEIEIEDLLRCMTLSATNAEKNAKCPLDHQAINLSFAGIASGKVAEAVQEIVDHLQGFLQSNSISLIQNLTK